jgi:hypothetical protein
MLSFYIPQKHDFVKSCVFFQNLSPVFFVIYVCKIVVVAMEPHTLIGFRLQLNVI